MSERKIYKPRQISGFPEWLPEVRLVEQQWLDHIRRVFESYGYCSIETPAVEELDVIAAKGGDGGADVDKEVYVLERLHKEPGDKEARLALHFDQTVPLARYVAQRFNDLVFPFKRYQMQKVWRGERPQAGRFREFYQCDIDVINVDNLPLSFDAEMPAIIWEILSSLPGMEKEKIQIRISNRKILLGFLEDWGVPDIAAILRILDKAEKVGETKTLSDLSKACSFIPSGESWTPANILMGLAKIKASTSQELKNEIEKLKRKPLTPRYLEGIEELCSVLDQLSHLPKGAIVADLSIVRGLDYYTGTVYETVFVDDPGYGSICSGGRYDDLASSYINKKLPGVGISIGFSRLFARLLEQGKLPVGPMSAADIMMVLPSEEKRAEASAVARVLRERGFKVELYHSGKKSFGDQMKYASRKKIPYVWFPETGEVKNMTTGDQTKADPATWKKH
jgi:histidyl-tRNA synthetase